MDVAATAIARDEEERRRDHEEEHEDHHGRQRGGARGGAPPSSSAPAGGGVGEPLLRSRHHRRNGDASADLDPDPTQSDPILSSAGEGLAVAGGQCACASLPLGSGDWCVK